MKKQSIETPDIHLAVSWDEKIPKQIIWDFLAAINAPDLKCVVEEEHRGEAYAGVELLLPTLFILWIAKPYFEAFLKEAGKDHYHILKQAILEACERLMGKSREIEISVVVSSGSPHKRSIETFSPVFSIIAPLGDHRFLKFVFKQEMTAKSRSKYTELILRTIERVSKDNPYLLELLEVNKKLIVLGHLVMTFDEQKNELVALR